MLFLGGLKLLDGLKRRSAAVTRSETPLQFITPALWPIELGEHLGRKQVSFSKGKNSRFGSCEASGCGPTSRPGRGLPRRRSSTASDGVVGATVTAQPKVTSSRGTVTRSDAVTSDTEMAGSRGQILQERVAEKQAEGLCLLIVVGGHGAFVAAFRNRAEIVLAHVNRQSPKSAASPFPVGSHSIGRRRHGALSLRREDSARKTVPKV
jgi:hypothetical protein